MGSWSPLTILGFCIWHQLQLKQDDLWFAKHNIDVLEIRPVLCICFSNDSTHTVRLLLDFTAA